MIDSLQGKWKISILHFAETRKTLRWILISCQPGSDAELRPQSSSSSPWEQSSQPSHCWDWQIKVPSSHLTSWLELQGAGGAAGSVLGKQGDSLKCNIWLTCRSADKIYKERENEVTDPV